MTLSHHAYYHGQPLQIGNETQLLLDDRIVEDRWRLQRVIAPVIKHPRNPVVVPDKPWEADSVLSPWVIRDEDYNRYRMWYKTHSASAGYQLCYAESDDGINWEKPMLNIVDFPGHSKTNMLYATAGTQVLKDTEEKNPERRYKLICDVQGQSRNRVAGVKAVYSPDGLHWEKDKAETTWLDYHSDCFNHVVYNPDSGCWLLYCRPGAMYAGWPYGRTLPDHQEGRRHMRRRVAVSTSKDLKTWSPPRICLYPDERDLPDIDSCCVFRYGGGFLMWYTAMNGDEDGWEETRLASSSDGFSWHRFHTREAFIPRGREGDWDHGQLSMICPPVPQDDRLLLYYSGTPGAQKIGDARGFNCIGVAKIKADRFVELRAGDEPAFLLTREFILEGNKLQVNLACPRKQYVSQYLKAEICRHPPAGCETDTRFYSTPYQGFSMEDCDPVTSDKPKVVTWRGGKSDIGELRGKPVYLRFQMRNLGIFSFRILAQS